MFNKFYKFALILLLFISTACNSLLFDQSSPQVIDCYPSDGASNVPADSVFSFTFSEKMDCESVERGLTLSMAGDEEIKGIFSWQGNTVTFTPLNPLDVNPEYRFKVDTSVEDKNGNNILNEYVISFTVIGKADNPEILWVNPSDGSYVTDNTNAIMIGFSTNMDLTSLQNAFTLSPSVSGIISTISNGNVLHFQPTTPYVYGTIYTITVSKDAKDMVGNPVAVEQSFTFTMGTDFTPPCLLTFATQGGTAILPGNDIITNISKSSLIILGFSENMDETATIGAFSIEPSVEGTVTVSESNLIFTPDTSFQSETLYTIKVADSAADFQGNTLGQEKHILFKTDASDSCYLRVLEMRGETNELWTQNISVSLTNSQLTNLAILFSAPVDYLTILPAFTIELVSGNNLEFSGSLGNVSFESNNHLMRFDLNDMGEDNIYKFNITIEGKDIWNNPLKEDWIFYFQT